MTGDSETIRWPTNLDRAAIEKRLARVAARAGELGASDIAQRFSAASTMSAKEIASGVVASLGWLASQPPPARERYASLTRDLEMVALNLKNLK